MPIHRVLLSAERSRCIALLVVFVVFETSFTHVGPIEVIRKAESSPDVFEFKGVHLFMLFAEFVMFTRWALVTMMLEYSFWRHARKMCMSCRFEEVGAD